MRETHECSARSKPEIRIPKAERNPKPEIRKSKRSGVAKNPGGILLVIFSSFSVEVGTPVARCPPHRSRRAVFPHRALQINSLSHESGGTVGGMDYPLAADRNSIP